MERNKILFVTKAQFGYLVDYNMYVKYLSDSYEIQFICMDQGKKYMNSLSIAFRNIKLNKLPFIKTFQFIKEVRRTERFFNPDFIHIQYFFGASLLKFLFPKKNLILDIRTASVVRSRLRRFAENSIIKFESLFFSNISVVSNGVKKKLNLNNQSIVIPVGGEIIQRKKYELDETLNLIYVGTFFNREIHKTISGLKLFLDKNPKLKCKYIIIGDGDFESMQKVKDTIERESMSKNVHLAGYIPNEHLTRFYDEAHVGISFIPINSYFNYQPPTKTYEYLLAGIPVIATNTVSNSEVINDQNGILINDSPESFCMGLIRMLASFEAYDDGQIRNTAIDYTWENITCTYRDSFLETKKTIN